MHFRSRLLIGLTTVFASAAIAVPAQAAEGSTPEPPTTTQTHMPTREPLEQLDRQLDNQLITEYGKRHAGEEASRRRVHCNWARCWWRQWIGPGYYVVGKFTWTGTWYMKNTVGNANTLAQAASVICGLIPGSRGICAALTWAIYNYFLAMTNRAIKQKRCLVQVNKLLGAGPPFFLRTAKCAR
jgi:hypothetical protein